MKTLHISILIITMAGILVTVNTSFAYEILHPSPVPVLYMESNTVGHLYVKFSTYYYNQTIKLGPMNIYDANLTNHTPLDLADLSIIPNRNSITLDSNSTVVDYTVTAKNNMTGIYALPLEQWGNLAPYVIGSDPQKIYQKKQTSFQCNLVPFIVGLDSSKIKEDVLNKFVTAAHSCPVSLIIKIPVGSQSISPLRGTIPSVVQIKNETSSISQGVMTAKMLSPLQQLKSGVKKPDIKCSQDFVLVIKKEGHWPACINPDTLSKLVLRGWTENPLDELLLRYGNQTQANLVFYEIMNEPKVRDWSVKGWKYDYNNYALNGETQKSSAIIHLSLPLTLEIIWNVKMVHMRL